MFAGMNDIFPEGPPVPARVITLQNTPRAKFWRFATSGLPPFIAACVAWWAAPGLWALGGLFPTIEGTPSAITAENLVFRGLLQADFAVFPVAVALSILAIRKNNRPGFANIAIVLSAVPAGVLCLTWAGDAIGLAVSLWSR